MGANMLNVVTLRSCAVGRSEIFDRSLAVDVEAVLAQAIRSLMRPAWDIGLVALATLACIPCLLARLQQATPLASCQ